MLQGLLGWSGQKALKMRAAGPRPARLLALRIGAVMLPLVAFGLIGAATWSAVHSGAQARVERVADMLREHARRAFETRDIALIAAESFASGMSWAEIRESASLRQALMALESAAPMAAGLALIDPEGRLATSSAGPMPLPRIDLTGRDYVRAHPRGTVPAAAPSVGEVLLTRPSGLLGFTLSRPRRGADGRGDGGVAVATLPPHELEAFYRDILEHPRDAVLLLRLDGLVLAGVPSAATPAATLAPRGVQDALRTAHADDLPTQWTTLAAGHGRHLTALRVLPTLGIAVAYGLAPEAVRGEWLRRMIVPGFAGIAGIILLLALVWQTERRLTAIGAAEARSRRTERQATLGLLAGGLAHDFGNITQSIVAAAHLLQRHAARPDRVRVIGEHLARHAERASALSRRMLNATHRAELRAARDARVPVTQALRDLVALLHTTLGAGIKVSGDIAPGLHGRGLDVAELETALINLAINSKDAMPGGGALSLKARRVALDASEANALMIPPGGYLCIELADDGHGMEAAVLRRYGEAFFSTKPAEQGSGLGVAMAAAFARVAGGALRAESEPGRGTLVRLYVPAAEPRPAGDPA